MNKVIFLDRDGTINIDKGYLCEKEKLDFIDGAIEGLRLLQNKGYKLIIVTNQSGIARGYFSESQFIEFQNYFCKVLEENGVHIEKTYYCPHLEGCECRKPKLKLFYDAIKEFNVDIENSFVIGDKLRDLALCECENINGFFITNEVKNFGENIKCIKNLLDASKEIVFKQKVES